MLITGICSQQVIICQNLVQGVNFQNCVIVAVVKWQISFMEVRKRKIQVLFMSKNNYTEEEQYWMTGGNTGTLPDRITPSMINVLEPNEIFVFGSNIQGMHMGGAARVAYSKFGAEWGNGEGLQGQSYALPTMEGIENTTAAARHFIACAKEHPELKFFVTPVGCGIAGYVPEDIAPMFREAAELENVYLPVSFWKVIMGIDKA